MTGKHRALKQGAAAYYNVIARAAVSSDDKMHWMVGSGLSLSRGTMENAHRGGDPGDGRRQTSGLRRSAWSRPQPIEHVRCAKQGLASRRREGGCASSCWAQHSTATCTRLHGRRVGRPCAHGRRHLTEAWLTLTYVPVTSPGRCMIHTIKTALKADRHSRAAACCLFLDLRRFAKFRRARRGPLSWADASSYRNRVKIDSGLMANARPAAPRPVPEGNWPHFLWSYASGSPTGRSPTPSASGDVAEATQARIHDDGQALRKLLSFRRPTTSYSLNCTGDRAMVVRHLEGLLFGACR